MAWENLLTAGSSQGGSAQSNWSQSQGQSYSETNGAAASANSSQEAAIAREWSAKQAELNREFQREMFEKEMEYNSREAEKSRAWSQAQVDVANEMANTIYTRSAANMKEAGINPILAYAHGLAGAGTGSVASAGQASVGAPSGSQAQSFMGQSFADQHSASSQWSRGEGSGSSWQQSTNGLAEGLTQMGELIKGAIENINSSHNINYTISNLAGSAKDTAKEIWNNLKAQLPSWMLAGLDTGAKDPKTGKYKGIVKGDSLPNNGG